MLNFKGKNICAFLFTIPGDSKLEMCKFDEEFKEWYYDVIQTNGKRYKVFVNEENNIVRINEKE